MTFQSPLALVALIAVPVIVAAYLWNERRRSAFASRFTNPALLPNLISARPGIRRHLPIAVLLVALTAMIVGVARPHATVSVPREEATVMIAIDSSLSMDAKDVKPTRLKAAQAAALQFIHEVPSKFRIGLVAFNGRPFVILPPTRDRAAAERALNAITTGNGTALGDAVKLSVDVGRRQRRGDSTIPPASLLVISDGAQRGGRIEPENAAAYARQQHVPIYSVALGTENGIIHAKLTGGYVQQIRVPASPDTLKQVAQTSGGEFFTAPTDTRLKDVYDRLASRLGHKRESREITDVFAGGSAALLLAGGLLGAMWLRRVP